MIIEQRKSEAYMTQYSIKPRRHPTFSGSKQLCVFGKRNIHAMSYNREGPKDNVNTRDFSSDWYMYFTHHSVAIR